MNLFNNDVKAYETMTILEAKTALSVATKSYFLLDAQGNYRVATRRARPLCLMGAAGIGKTEIVAQVAEEEDLAFCSYSLVHHTRQSLLGLPRLENQVWGDEEVACTRYTMSEIIDQIHQTMEKTRKTKGILFLDEFNCASESVRPVMLQLLQEKALGTHKIPEGWMLVLAGNPTQYNKSAKDLDPVTLDRVRLLHVEPNLDVWMSYGKKTGIHHVILSYLDENPNCFYRYQSGKSQNSGELVTPRGWEDLSIQLSLMEEQGIDVTASFIGQFFQCAEVVHTFYMYYRRFASMNVTGLVQRVLERNPNSIEEIQGLNVQDRWALVTSVVTRIKGLTEKLSVRESQIDRIHGLLKDHRGTMEKGTATAITTLHEIGNSLFFEDKIREELVRCANSLQSEDGWQDISDYFQNELVKPIVALRKKATLQIDNMLFICSEAITDAENTERLLHSILDDKRSIDFIASADIPAFQVLCSNTDFDGSDILKATNRGTEGNDQLPF